MSGSGDDLMIPMIWCGWRWGPLLRGGVRVIPVLVEGAVMPRREDLPEDLADLAQRNALRIRHESFRDDAGRLVTAIERVLAPAVVGDAEDGRAARLLGEAERLVKTFTDGSGKALALIEVANAVAVSDPGGAVRIANSISNE
jgi:hypothetical protein